MRHASVAKKQIDELKKDQSHLRGKLSQLTGKFPTALDHVPNTSYSPSSIAKVNFGAAKSASPCQLDGVVDERSLNIIDVRERFAACGFPIFQRADGKQIEIDLHAKSSDGRVVLVEVKKTQDPMGSRAIEEFQEKIEAYQQSQHHPSAGLSVVGRLYRAGG